jgi:hypothetical protein
MIDSTQSIALALVLFIGMLLCQWFGHRLGRRDLKKSATALKISTGVAEGAVLGLLGLLLAFSFSAAENRLDNRRQLIVQESNAIGTAWLRLDLLPPADQPALRDLMRRYIDQRIKTYENVANIPETLAHNRQAIDLQNEIWNRARQSCQAGGSQSATMLVIPALNDMIDITSSRAAATRTHAPPLILFLPFAVALFSALVAGYAMAESDRLKLLHALIFAAVVSITIYVILDLEYPRTGMVREDQADQAMYDQRDAMK